MKQKDDDDQADDDRFFEKIPLQCLDGCIDQIGAVVSRHDLDAGRKRWRNLVELLLDSIDNVQRIHPLTHYDNSTDGFALSIPLRNSFADVGTEAHCSQIA